MIGRHGIGTALVLSVFLSFCFAERSACAGEEFDHGRFGLSASVQSNQVDILVPMWIADEVVVSPTVSFVHVGDGSSFSDIGFGALLRYNVRRGRAVPFLGARVVARIVSPDEGDNITDFVFGGVFGGEYFLNGHFSLAVEGQLNTAVSDDDSNRFGNPGGTNINTATTVLATFYF